MNYGKQLDRDAAPFVTDLGVSFTSSVASPLTSALQVADGVDMRRLVGAPHLFARLKSLRNGVMFQPIGAMTLQPDGRITGYSHPNEGSWIAYSHGPVPADKAFAFVTVDNNWIPSSTWTQSMGDIPIGFFCDEPESLKAVERLCLIPHQASSDGSGVVYLIASCLKFYERTLPVLLGQLFDEGIPRERIKVVVNGCDADRDEVIDGIDYAFSRHDGWEWSTLYEGPRRWEFDYAFLMHDTNVIFPGFRRSVETFNRHLPWDHLPASPLARCLLGLYSHDFLTRLNPWLKGTDRISKKEGVIAEASAELLLRARLALVMSDAEQNGAASPAVWKETVDYFNTGSPRVRRVFPAVKLHKFIHTGPANPDSL